MILMLSPYHSSAQLTNSNIDSTLTRAKRILVLYIIKYFKHVLLYVRYHFIESGFLGNIETLVQI